MTWEWVAFTAVVLTFGLFIVAAVMGSTKSRRRDDNTKIFKG